jgi:hypothetical protein
LAAGAGSSNARRSISGAVCSNNSQFENWD